MWQHAAAIAWAQFRIGRNHLPRTGSGTIFTSLLMLLWYGLYAAFAIFLAVKIPEFRLAPFAGWLSAGLLAVFLFWQIIPLFTLSAGWSLQLNKIQIYPVRNETLFAIEVVLRITSAPEMIIVLCGALTGLLRHGHIPIWAPFCLALFIPLNLFLQLALRDLILHSFERNRFRELFAVLLISVAVLPQLVLRTGLGLTLKPYFLLFARNHAAPWAETASLAIGRGSFRDLALLAAWTVLTYAFARWAFAKSLGAQDDLQSNSKVPARIKADSRAALASWPSRIFRDPLAALMQKELQSLVRMPKFRVLFGMACVFGMVVFVPASLRAQDSVGHFIRNNLIPVVNLYGLLLLSDALLLNSFGFDRGAVQAYFVTPVSLATVLLAKNLTAIVFVILQSTAVICVAAAASVPMSLKSIASGLLASAVVTVFLLTTGNFTSLTMPRPLDPRQTFKKQAGARMQIWLLGCSVGLFLLVGFAYLARYALQRDWVFFAVLAFECGVGVLMYRFGLESAAQRGSRDREQIVQALTASGSPLSLS